jgi:hypothetical protein
MFLCVKKYLGKVPPTDYLIDLFVSFKVFFDLVGKRQYINQ